MPQLDLRPPRKIASALLVAGLLAPAPLRAGEATGAGQVSARVIRPLVLANLADLDFGLVRAHPLQGGSVVVPASGETARFTGGASSACAGSSCPAPHAAAFSVSGEPGRTYVVSIVPLLAISATGAGGPDLAVSHFTVSTQSRGNDGRSGTLDAAGRDAFRIGGTLNVPAGLAPARYRRALPVTVSYE